MSWSIARIYTLPHPSVIQFFRDIQGPEIIQYHINDLRGIQSEWTLNNIYSDKPTERSHLRHGLPEGGLLAIKIKHDQNDMGRTQDKTPDAWVTIDNTYQKVTNLPETLRINEEQTSIISILQSLNMQTHIPMVYYKCETWGGDVDEEYAIVCNQGITVYGYESKDSTLQFKDGKTTPSALDTLLAALQHIGLTLPTGYFALHERNFDWETYKII